MTKEPVVFFDLDSTLADTTHRVHLIEEARARGQEPDWDAYSLACEDDVPIAGAVALTQMLRKGGYHVVIVTSRSDAAFHETLRWLHKHGVGFSEIMMSRSGEHTMSLEQYKVDAIRRWLTNNNVEGPALIVEDWPPIKRVLEDEGWTVLLTNPNYHEDEYIAAHTIPVAESVT